MDEYTNRASIDKGKNCLMDDNEEKTEALPRRMREVEGNLVTAIF